jgi:hypothetical protein
LLCPVHRSMRDEFQRFRYDARKHKEEGKAPERFAPKRPGQVWGLRQVLDVFSTSFQAEGFKQGIRNTFLRVCLAKYPDTGQFRKFPGVAAYKGILEGTAKEHERVLNAADHLDLLRVHGRDEVDSDVSDTEALAGDDDTDDASSDDE